MAHASRSRSPSSGHVPNAAHVRLERAGSGRVTDLGGADARARHTRNAVQGLRAVHPELDATRWQRARGPYGPERAAAYSRNTPDGDRFRSGDRGNQGVVWEGFPKSTFSGPTT